MKAESRNAVTMLGKARFVGPAVLVGAAWLPGMLAIIISEASEMPMGRMLRLAVTALVYAPVAAIVLARRLRGVAVIVGGLSVTSGIAALAIVLDRLFEQWSGAGLGPAASLTVAIARQAEIAALSILLWLFVRSSVRRLGIALGAAAIVLDSSIWALRLAHVPVERWVVLIPAIVALAGFPFASALLVRQWWRGSSAERAILSWFAVSAVLLLVSYLQVIEGLPRLVLVASDAAFVIAQGFLPTAILAAAVGVSRTLVDRRLVTGVVWAQSLAVSIGLYLVLDATAEEFGVPPALAGGLAAAALALLFNWMLRVIRRRTARVFVGLGADARTVLSRLGESLRTDSPRGGLDCIADSLRAVWHLDSVTITPAGDGEEIRIGDDGEYALDRQLTLTGRTAGRVRLTASDPGLLTQVVEPVLDAVAPLIAVATRLAEANHETEATRRRIITVQREERKLLHRQLHDELAPALAGIALGMRAAGHVIASSPRDASTRIEELRVALAERVDDVRRLARALLPVALDAGDLEGALHELARRFAASGVTVGVSAEGADALEPHTQIALYLALTDALDVVRRESPEASVTLFVDPESPHSARVVLDEVETEPASSPSCHDAMLAAVVRHCEAAGVSANRVGTPAGLAIELSVPA